MEKKTRPASRPAAAARETDERRFIDTPEHVAILTARQKAVPVIGDKADGIDRSVVRLDHSTRLRGKEGVGRKVQWCARASPGTKMWARPPTCLVRDSISQMAMAPVVDAVAIMFPQSDGK